jgi:hypothetical protein
MKTLILTSYFSSKPHPNDPSDSAVVGRGPDGRVIQQDINYIKGWYDSIHSSGVNAVVFHDELSDEFTRRYTTDQISFERVGVGDYSNNDWRFFCFGDYLSKMKSKPEVVFHTDGSDVKVVKDPIDFVFKKPEISYFCCKDSIPLNMFPYIKVHDHFGWEDKFNFMLNYQDWDLINMGVIGGRFEDMLLFYSKFKEVREGMGDPSFNADMWICQYLLRSVLSDKEFLMGEPVCSKYKEYEEDRTDVYFIHK